MAKLAAKKVVTKKVIETPIEEVTPEVIEEVKKILDVRTPEEKFIEGLDKLIDGQIRAGGNQFLPKEAVINLFKSVTRI